LASAAFAEDAAPDMTQAGPAIAERFYIAPMFSYTIAANDRNAGNSTRWALAVGK